MVFNHTLTPGTSVNETQKNNRCMAFAPFLRLFFAIFVYRVGLKNAALILRSFASVHFADVQILAAAYLLLG